MFDIGFAELIIIGIVSLLVIGPERLPATIRTTSLWLNRIKRGFNDIKQEVQQELHNDSVMQELKKTGEQLRQQTDSLGQDINKAGSALNEQLGISESDADTGHALPAHSTGGDSAAEMANPDTVTPGRQARESEPAKPSHD
tara:strand:- start:359049 stop:359474 length:426 start_codon:yes stop_codon:yes gene_type:complete